MRKTLCRAATSLTKKFMLLVATIFMSITVHAYDIAVKNADGVTIYYNYINNGTELEVTTSSKYNLRYSGSVVIPEEVTYGDEVLKVTSIGNYAFQSCENLASLTIPNCIIKIGDYAFQDCKNLASLTIPNSVTSIGDFAFFCCSSMVSLIIPDSVTSIGRSAFNYCSNLTSVTISNGVAIIDEYVFHKCSSLTSISIPNSVTSIGSCAFDGCYSLTSVEIPSSVTAIGSYAFRDCSNLDSVVIPNGVTSIEKATFGNCECLTSVIVPNSVTSIGGAAFGGCNSLTSVTIGSGVTSIGNYAFGDCENLMTIISLIEEPFGIQGKSSLSATFSEYVFMDATLYVPAGTSEKYKATDGWMDFDHIVEGLPEGILSTSMRETSPSALYDLSGRRLEQKPSKGIYIQNGRVMIQR